MSSKPTGRPPGPCAIKFDWSKVDHLLECGCTGEEVAAYFGCHADTFYRRVEQEKGVGFTAYCREKRTKGDSLLKAKQFNLALKGDKTLLVWLGKQRLGQKENPQDFVIDEKALKQFTALMDQFTKFQSDRIQANQSNNIDSKSECETGANLADDGSPL